MKNQILDNPYNLVHQFALMKDWLPKGRLSRWETFRAMFIINHSAKNWPATRAIWELNDYGEKTRLRWVEEYRHQRRLSSIERGTDYQEDDDYNYPLQIIE